MSKFLPELKVDDDSNYIAMFVDAEVDEVPGQVFESYIKLDTKNLDYMIVDYTMIEEMIEMMKKVEKINKKKYDTKRIY
jgi:hypothetical protein